MLARVADSLYWMARYLERAEFTARLVGLQIQRLPVGTAVEVATGWRLLFAGIGNEPPESESLGNMEDDDFLFVDGYTLTDILTFEKGNPAAIANCLAAARENAREVRGAIGPGIWSSINREYLELRRTRLVEIWNREPELLCRDVAEGIPAVPRHLRCVDAPAAASGASCSWADTSSEHNSWCPCSWRTAAMRPPVNMAVSGRCCCAPATRSRPTGANAAPCSRGTPSSGYSSTKATCRTRCVSVAAAAREPEVIGPAPSEAPGVGPFEILARLDDQFGDGAQIAGNRQPLAASDLQPLGELFRTFHDALEGSYAFPASDA